MISYSSGSYFFLLDQNLLEKTKTRIMFLPTKSQIIFVIPLVSVASKATNLVIPMSYCFEDVDGEHETQGPVHGGTNIFLHLDCARIL